jgi:hypothetical protein
MIHTQSHQVPTGGLLGTAQDNKAQGERAAAGLDPGPPLVLYPSISANEPKESLTQLIGSP